MASMNLSTAIRRGSKLRPQCFGTWSMKATCALGAAVDAISGKMPKTAGEWHENNMDVHDLCLRFPILMLMTDEFGSSYSCGCHKYADRLFEQIIHLNDYHKWTREAIADWVETVEQLSM